MQVFPADWQNVFSGSSYFMAAGKGIMAEYFVAVLSLMNTLSLTFAESLDPSIAFFA